MLDRMASPPLVLLVNPSIEELRTMIDPAKTSFSEAEFTVERMFTGFERTQYALFVRTRDYSPSAGR